MLLRRGRIPHEPDYIDELESPRFGAEPTISNIRSRIEEIQNAPLHVARSAESTEVLEGKIRVLEEQLTSLASKYERAVVDNFNLTPLREEFPYRTSALVTGLRNKLANDTASDTSTGGQMTAEPATPAPDPAVDDVSDVSRAATNVSDTASALDDSENVLTTIEPKVIRVLVPKTVTEAEDIKVHCLRTRRDIESLLKKYVALRVKFKKAEARLEAAEERFEARVTKLKESNKELRELVPLVEKQDEHLVGLHSVLESTENELVVARQELSRCTERAAHSEAREEALARQVDTLTNQSWDLREQLAASVSKLETLENDHVRELERVRGDCAAALAVAEEKQKAVEAARERATAEVEKLASDIESARRESNQSAETSAVLVAENKRVAAERDALLEKQRLLLSSAEEVEKHVGNLKVRVVSLERDLVTERAKTEEVQRQLMLKDTEFAQSEARAGALLLRVEESQSSAESRQSELADLRCELERERQGNVDCRRAHEEEKRKHLALIMDLERKLKEAKDYIWVIKGNYDRLAQDPEALVDHLEPIRKGLVRKKCARSRPREHAASPGQLPQQNQQTQQHQPHPQHSCQKPQPAHPQPQPHHPPQAVHPSKPRVDYHVESRVDASDELAAVVHAVDSFESGLRSPPSPTYQPPLVQDPCPPDQWIEPTTVPVYFRRRTRSKSAVPLPTPRFGL